jgi:hypothetical protein
MAYSVWDDLCSDRGLRHAFGYLLPVVRANATITYGEIAAKLAKDLQIDGKVFPIHIGHVAGSLMERILKVDKAAPLINVLVVNQTGQPGKGMDGFLRDRFHLPENQTIRERRRRELIAQAAVAAYAFKGWPQLYRRLFKEDPPPADPISLIEGGEEDGIPPASSRFGGLAESEEHRKLKEYVLRHPKKIGAPSAPDDARTELMLLSGDEVDVYIAKGDAVHLVEVKSIRSTEPDLVRGVFQCIKYRAVFQAQRAGTTPNLRIEATLVVENEPSSNIRDLAKRHHVRLIVVVVNG